MDVSALQTTVPTGTTASTTTSTTKAQTDYQSFLKLLVAQMKNQDPTKPNDSTEFVAQLAQFSQVEQSIQLNTKLDGLLQSSSLSQADALIGRTITSADGAITGTVKEVKIASSGATAVLVNGQEVAIGAGIKISAGASS